MSLEVGTGKAGESNELLTAFQRGRYDYQFFAETFLGETLHDGQLKWITEAQATVNVLASSNRYGKTFLIPCGHFHANIYKTGAESRYMKDDGTVDIEKYLKLKYHTIHTADGWETAALVWEEAQKLYKSRPALAAFVPQGGAPRSLPPHFDFINGARWKFRTLGHDASGIDGDSFYLISIDEAGWVANLEEKMRNVIRVRVADVRTSTKPLCALRLTPGRQLVLTTGTMWMTRASLVTWHPQSASTSETSGSTWTNTPTR